MNGLNFCVCFFLNLKQQHQQRKKNEARCANRHSENGEIVFHLNFNMKTWQVKNGNDLKVINPIRSVINFKIKQQKKKNARIHIDFHQNDNN